MLVPCPVIFPIGNPQTGSGNYVCIRPIRPSKKCNLTSAFAFLPAKKGAELSQGACVSGLGH